MKCDDAITRSWCGCAPRSKLAASRPDSTRDGVVQVSSVGELAGDPSRDRRRAGRSLRARCATGQTGPMGLLGVERQNSARIPNELCIKIEQHALQLLPVAIFQEKRSGGAVRVWASLRASGGLVCRDDRKRDKMSCKMNQNLDKTASGRTRTLLERRNPPRMGGDPRSDAGFRR